MWPWSRIRELRGRIKLLKITIDTLQSHVIETGWDLGRIRERNVLLIDVVGEACRENNALKERCDDLAATNRALVAWNAKLISEQGELQKPEPPPDIVGQDALAIHDMIVELGDLYRNEILNVFKEVEGKADAVALAITRAREHMETIGIARLPKP